MGRLRRTLLGGLALLLLPAAAAAQPAPVKAPWENARADTRAWTEALYAAIGELGKNLTGAPPKDAATFCPNYAALGEHDRKNFWVFLIAALARYESGWRPELVYVEPDARQANARFAMTRGLLQISFDAAGAKTSNCGLSAPEELNDPIKNLRCGVRILDHWIDHDDVIVGHDGKAWLGAARYWRAFRRAEQKAALVAATRNLPFCKTK